MNCGTGFSLEDDENFVIKNVPKLTKNVILSLKLNNVDLTCFADCIFMIVNRYMKTSPKT